MENQKTQKLLHGFQRTMKKNAPTNKSRWKNLVGNSETISLQKFAQRMNTYGLISTTSEVAQLWEYVGIYNDSMNFDDFVKMLRKDSDMGFTTTINANPRDTEQLEQPSIKTRSIQFVDGTPKPKPDDLALKKMIAKIADIAYQCHHGSKECFFKWRNFHHDRLTAEDIKTALEHDAKFVISLEDAQRVVDKYGGPMTHVTFEKMLCDSSKYSMLL